MKNNVLFSYATKGKKPTHDIYENTQYRYIDEIGTFKLNEGCICFHTNTGEFQQTPNDFVSQCKSTGHPVEIPN